MLGDGLYNSGDKGSYFKYQYGVLKLLEIEAGIGMTMTAFSNATHAGLVAAMNAFIVANPKKAYKNTTITEAGGVFYGTFLHN